MNLQRQLKESKTLRAFEKYGEMNGPAATASYKMLNYQVVRVQDFMPPFQDLRSDIFAMDNFGTQMTSLLSNIKIAETCKDKFCCFVQI